MTTTAHRLDGDGQTLVLASNDRRMPRLLYWGEALPDRTDLGELARAVEPALPHGGLDVEEVVSWLPEPGRGFTDSPGLALRRGQRQLYTQFVVQAAAAVDQGWRFELADAAGGLELVLQLRIDPDSGVVSADCTLVNQGADDLAIDALVTLALPIPGHLRMRQSLGGRWAGEFQVVREPIGSAGWLQEARVGRTSHHAFPGLVLTTPGADAGAGEAWSIQLAWSGNHRLLLQRCRFGGLQLQAGELLLPGEVTLQPGQSHATPTLHLARSGRGLRELSLRWHRFVRRRVLSPAPGPRLVQFNTWEATYFAHDAQRLSALAQAAAELGVERFILDDGWFVGRHHDRAGLGDWVPCPQRYPHGLAPLAEHCRSLGMQFGLWVEPEGVSPDSSMYRAHPEWVMGIPGLEQPLGRHQYVLNLGLPAARAYLLERLDGLLRSAPIGFLKWDMNRDMTHAAGPDGRAAVRAHVLGLYEVLDRLRQSFPALEIESCASGGGRADLGILRRMSRVWVSDCNDPLERQRSQRGFLGFFPPELMGVHVGDARSHTTGRVLEMPLRTLNALFGHFGIEADLLALAADDRRRLKAAVAVYKAERGWLHSGDVTPIDHPDPAVCAVLAMTADGARGLISVVAVERTQSAMPQPLQIAGLAPDATYRVSQHPLWWPDEKAGKTTTALHRSAESIALTGRTLAATGMTLPLLAPGGVVLFRLHRTAT